MPKLKTRKSVSSRIKVTKSKKYVRRRAGHGHFNSRETGNARRRKQNDMDVSKAEHGALKALLPYN